MFKIAIEKTPPGEGYSDLDRASVLRAAQDVKNMIMSPSWPGVFKQPQDMSLRELFDHVAIVNDAIRAALASHPGMQPKREG